mmetsp:Transcript_23339/g.55434  ORF Transcript_23339/g.55434 Transcript_23339/m.55434 type:complete len:260 (+) Transcript_23339:1-780(+)
MLLALLEQWHGHALQRRLLGLAALQGLSAVQGQEARVGAGVGGLLPCRRVAEPQPGHGASRHQASQLLQRQGALPLQRLVGFLGLLQCGGLLGLLQGSAGLLFPAPGPLVLLRGQQPLAGPAQEEGCNLRGSTQRFRAVLILVLGSLLGLLQATRFGDEPFGCICEQVHHPRMQTFFQPLPCLEHGKQQRESLGICKVLALAGQQLSNQLVQSLVELLLAPGLHVRQVCGPEPAICWLGQQLLGLEGYRKLHDQDDWTL